MSDSLISNMDTGTRNISNKGAGAFPVSFGYYPEEGSRAITMQWNFQQQNFYVEDLSILVSMGVQTAMQSAFVDNSRNGYPVTFSIQGSGQVIQIPAYSQGVFPFFFTGTPLMQVNCPVASNGVTALTLLNVPINSAGIWEATQLGLPTADQAYLSKLGITGTVLVRAGVARLYRVSVTTTTATGTITIDDAAATGTVATVLTVPIGATVGTVYSPSWPMFNGIAVNYNGGATGTIAIAYS